MRKRTKSRETALKILYRLDITGEEVDSVLDDFWQDHKHVEDVKEFASRLVKGVVDKKSELDRIIIVHAENWSLKRMAVIDRNILRMASYEILFVDDIPYKVSINEAIDLAKKYSNMDSGKFVNGILDRIKKVELDGNQ